jgi:2-keto-3-deoxy-L-rhamnonate aldolase RhmA
MTPDAMTRERLRASLTLAHRLRAAYAEGTVRGTFVIELPTPRAIRALALAGFDFVVLDLEHSPADVASLPPLISEAHACGLPVLVRPWGHDGGMIGKLLDLGANGVLIPHVGSAAEAGAVAAAARYAPLGVRGVCPLIGTTAFSDPVAELGRAPLVLVQIEGRAGLANAAEIAAVAGIDGVFVGPHDLSHALGAPGEVEGAAVADAAASIAEGAGEDLMLGVYVDDPRDSVRWALRGYRFQCIDFDGRMLLERARATLDAARNGRVDTTHDRSPA